MTASLLNMPTVKNFSTDSREWLQTARNELLDFVEIYRKYLLASSALLFALLGLFLVLWRKGVIQNIPLFIPRYHGRLVGSQPAVRLMDRLWLQLFRKYGAKSAHQTVREYVHALRIENTAQKQALLEFALMYETVRYDTPGRPVYSKREIIAVWKAIRS